MKLKSTETDLGILLVWMCPQCGVDRAFHLISRTAGISLASVEFSKSDEMLDLRCNTCAYEIRVSIDDKNALQETAILTHSFLQGRLTHCDYHAKIHATDARFISDIISLTEEWLCPECSEQNPATFFQCWNCSYSKPDIGDPESNIQPPPPQINEGGKNPWEL